MPRLGCTAVKGGGVGQCQLNSLSEDTQNAFTWFPPVFLPIFLETFFITQIAFPSCLLRQRGESPRKER